MDMSNKTKFYKNVLNQLKSDSNCSLNSDQMTLMKFLFDRVLNQNLNLEQSEKNLELATETFMKLVDESLADQSDKLNKIMLVEGTRTNNNINDGGGYRIMKGERC